MATQYELDRIARVKARAERKAAGSKKKTPVVKQTAAQREQTDIDTYRKRYQTGKKQDTRPLSTLGDFGKKPEKSVPGAASGGSQTVRQVTGESLVDRIRKNPGRYIKPKVKKNNK